MSNIVSKTVSIYHIIIGKTVSILYYETLIIGFTDLILLIL